LFVIDYVLIMSEEVDYGYGDCQPDDGYGDGTPAAAAVDYGYGDEAVAPTSAIGTKIIDYVKKSSDNGMDYGYGDGDPMDYGYGDDDGESPAVAHETTAPSPLEDRRPKRRCSVTKYTIENEDQESPLTAHTRINDFRNGSCSVVVVDDAKSTTTTSTPETVSSAVETKSSAASSETDGAAKKKKGMMHRIRKRLSIV
jgi:hypothetical protein